MDGDTAGIPVPGGTAGLSAASSRSSRTAQSSHRPLWLTARCDGSVLVDRHNLPAVVARAGRGRHRAPEWTGIRHAPSVRAVPVLAVLWLLPLTAACGPATCEEFALSLASDRGGAVSPVAAAEEFAVSWDVPRTGWQVVDEDGTGVELRSGGATLHAVRGPDATWQVDSGRRC